MIESTLMKLLSLVCMCAFALVAAPVSANQAVADQAKKAPAAKAKAATGGARTIEITGSETMKYDVTEITAKPGEKLRVVLKAVGTMPKIAMGHNFVLLKAGASAMEVSNAAFNARDTDFIPASMKDKILAFTKVAGGGETVEVTFTAPAKPGKYDYLCTFPGHFAAGMKGTLTVK
jgi:azurin